MQVGMCTSSKLLTPPVLSAFLLRQHRWLDKAARALRESDEEFWACPRASCTWGCFLSTREDGNIFECQVCGTRWCITCDVSMHDNEACSDYQDRITNGQRSREDQEEASKKLVEAESKACPKCTARIEKTHGCDHMICTIGLYVLL